MHTESAPNHISPNSSGGKKRRRFTSYFTLTFTVLMAFCMVSVAVIGPATKEAEALPIIIIPAFIAGVAIGHFISDYLNKGQTDASGNVLDSYRQSTAQQYLNMLELAKSTTLNDAELADLTTNYYARIGEMAALALYQYQKANNLSFNYNANELFKRGNVYDTLKNQYEMAITSYKEIFKTLEDFQDRFIGDYSSMQITHNGNTAYPGTAANNLKFVIANKITFDTQNDGVANKHLFNENSTFYMWRSTERATTLTLKYENGTTAGSWSGTLLASNVLSVVAISTIIPNFPGGNIILSVHGSNTLGTNIYASDTYATFTGTKDGSQSPGLISYRNITTWAKYLGGVNTYVMASENNINIIGGGTTSIPLMSHINAIGQAYDKIKTLATVCANYGQTYYNYLVINGDEGIPYTGPSVLPINPEQMANMTYAELYAIYLAYMLALMDGFENGYTVTPGNVNMSVASLNLVCRGTIYNATGGIIANNQSIFTPFPTIADLELNIGNNTMTQPGFIIKWGKSTTIEEQMRDPSNDSFTPKTMRYISYGINWTLDIEEMYYLGIPADSVTLHVTNLTVYDPTLTPPPEGPNILNDYEWLLSRWYYFAIVAGILCMVAAISFRNTSIIIVGLVLLASGGIGYYLAGDYSIWDALLSIEPPNLTAWIQNIR